MKKLYIYLLLLFPLVSKTQINLNPVFDHIDPEKFGVAWMGTPLWDKKGGTWITCDKGILYYNGYSHRIYTRLPNDTVPLEKNIFGFYMDKQDRIWMGHGLYGGLTCFNTRTNDVKHYWPDSTKKNTMPYDIALSGFFEDSKGYLWIMTWGGGMYKLLNENTGDFIVYKRYTRVNENRKLDEPAHNFIKDIDELPDGRFFISYFENAGYSSPPDYFDPAKGIFTSFPVAEYQTESPQEAYFVQVASKIVHNTWFDQNNGLWMATYSGLLYFDLKQKTVKRVSGNPLKNRMNLENTRSIAVMDNGHLWLSTVSSGIMVVNPKTFEVGYILQDIHSETSLSDNLVGVIKKDPWGNIWISTGTGIIDIYNPLRQQFNVVPWEVLKTQYSDRSSQRVPINDMHLAADGLLYMSNYHGIAVYDVEKKQLRESLSLGPINTEENNVQLFKIIDRYIYAQSPTIRVYDRVTKKVKPIESKNSYMYIQHDPSQDVIYYSVIPKGKPEKMVRYNIKSNTTDTLFDIPRRLHTRNRPALILPKNRYVIHSWYPTGFILADLNKNTVERYGSDTMATKNIPPFQIHSFSPHTDGNLWLCTSKGLYYFNLDTETCEEWNTKIGLNPNDEVVHMIWDNKKYYWLGGDKQIIRFDPKTNQTFRFNSQLGMKAGTFDVNIAPCIDQSGRIYFATVKGLLIIQPDQIKTPEKQPVLFLSSLVVKDDTLDLKRLENFIAGKTIFEHNQNFLYLEFASNEAYSPVPSHFYYRLIGLDSTWQNNGTSNIVRYNSLSHGKYLLEVKCVNAFGIQSQVLQVPFEIKRPYWKAWWFFVIIAALLVFIITLLIRVRERALRKKQEELERKVEERTAEVVEQKEIIEEKNRELTDSIYYAQRIQQSILPDQDQLSKQLSEHFIYFKPKDIVSGDFYWYAAHHDSVLVAVVDCTGHGVPGGFMSMLGSGLLNQIVNEELKLEPAEILNHLRERVILALKQTGAEGENRDGMDVSLCRIIKSTGTLQFAGANNSLYLVRNGELQELKADKQPIGIHVGERIPFTQHEVKLQPNDHLYMSSDGYADQFGGPKGKKFKTSNFEKLLLQISNFAMPEQCRQIDQIFNDWKSDYEQLDDICVVGIKL